MKLNFRGLIAPVLTPMTNDGSYNILLGDIPRYAKFLASKGVNGILVNGTSGEGPSLTLAERKATTKAWVDAVKQTKQHLMVQVGGTCLKDVEELATHAENIGSDSLLCLPELFNKPATVEDLVRYLKIVGKAAPNTPLLYYHNPSYTGVRINMPQFLEAAASNIPTFAGIKFTDTNIDEGTQCLLVAEGKLAFFLGCDQVLAGAFTLGIDSAIATTLNMYAEPSIKMLDAINNHKPAEALQEQRKLNNVIKIITRNGGWVATMKVAMGLMASIDMGPPRPPLVALTDAQIEQMKKELGALKLLH